MTSDNFSSPSTALFQDLPLWFLCIVTVSCQICPICSETFRRYSTFYHSAYTISFHSSTWTYLSIFSSSVLVEERDVRARGTQLVARV